MSISISQWDIWFAEFPFEDMEGSKDRPVIVINVEPLEVLSIKVTSHDLRFKDKFDTPIIKWQYANLKQPSVARISKTIYLTIDKFRRKLGVLHEHDRQAIMQRYIEYLHSN